MVREAEAKARNSQRGRFRYCLHRSVEESVQEMVLAITDHVYFRPHIHPMGKSESYHIMSGALSVFVFDDQGNITERHDLDDDNLENPLVLRFNDPVWHLPVAITDIAVYHEVYKGPFERADDVIFAEWAPDETDTEKCRRYLDDLRNGSAGG
jgi:glucose-6-phosphate isomerase